jgi:uncharacterized membrane protein
MGTIIIIWTVSFIIEVVSFYFFRKSFIKIIKRPDMNILVQMWEGLTTMMASGRKFKRAIFNPYTYFIAGVILFIISPLLVPVSIYSLIKKLFRIKSKADKVIKNEVNSINEAREQSEDFLKHEGMLDL